MAALSLVGQRQINTIPCRIVLSTALSFIYSLICAAVCETLNIHTNTPHTDNCAIITMIPFDLYAIGVAISAVISALSFFVPFFCLCKANCFYWDSLDNGPLFWGIETDELFFNLQYEYVQIRLKMFLVFFRASSIVCHLLTPDFVFAVSFFVACQMALLQTDAEQIRTFNVAVAKAMNRAKQNHSQITVKPI